MAEKEGDQILFGCQEEHDRQSWVMALCRATGQQHRPEPIRKQSNDIGSHVHTQSVSRRIGLDDFLQTDVSTFDHSALFAKLQAMTLSYRLCERSCNLVGNCTDMIKACDVHSVCRVGSHPDKCLCWMSIVLAMVFVKHIVTCVGFRSNWKECCKAM